MTQTVYDNAMVAHVWAQRSQEHGRSHNGNYSFRGDVLYSYSTPIAAFVDVPGKGYAVLVTSRSYSITTSGKHMPPIWRALSEAGYSNEFTVPNVRPLTKADHEANQDHLLERYHGDANRVLRMRDYYGNEQTLAEALRERADKVERYEELFDLPRTSLAPEQRAKDVMAGRAEREARLNTPEAEAKREKARAKREEAKARKAELERLEGLELVEAWKRGEPVSLRWGQGLDEHHGALLRVRGETLETSLGAKVPLEQAVRVFKFVKLCKSRGQGSAPHPNLAWQRNGTRLPVGHFELDHVTTAGSFRAGCHLIHWPEIERVAKEVGVFDTPAEDTTLVRGAARIA